MAFLVLAAGCGQGPTQQETIAEPEPRDSAPSQRLHRRPPPPPSSTAGALPLRPARTALRAVRLSLSQVAAVPQAIAVAVVPGDDRLFVAQRHGRVVAIRNGEIESPPVLDLSPEVAVEGELGLVGIAPSPEGDRMYVSFTDTRGWLRVLEHAIRTGQPDPGSRRTVLRIRQPTSIHVGGDLAFGPDGYLWMSVGDGGPGGDPQDRAQSLSTLRGKVLRIDPTPGDGRPYAIPEDNPFVGRAGRPEIYAYGLRNPWRFSFDRRTRDLWIADVGQYTMEEINLLGAARPAGANFGWNRLEGTRPFSGRPPADAVAPLAEYERGEGRCAVIGGHVYRGGRIEGLHGAYVFADLCDGRVRALLERNGRAVFARDLGIGVDAPVSFGEDATGELIVVSLTEGVFRIEPA